MSRKCFSSGSTLWLPQRQGTSCLFKTSAISEVLSDCNGSWTHSHLGHKRTLSHLAKLATNLWVFVYELEGVDSINYKCKKNTYIWDNIYLYLKITCACLTDYDRNAMSWKSTSTYAKGIALTPTKVFNICLYLRKHK